MKTPPRSGAHDVSPVPLLPSKPRYIFWLLFIVSFLNYLDRNVLTGAVNTIAKELHFSLDGVGYLSSAFLIVYTLGTFPLGVWADRIPRKNIVALSVAVWSLATAATALATNFLTLFLSRMIMGIGEAGYFPAGTALLSDCYARERRSRVMSSWGSAQYIGILGGFALGGVAAGLFTGSWRYAFLLTGIPGLVLAFFIWRIHEPRRNQADEEAGARDAADLVDPAAGAVPVLREDATSISLTERVRSLVRVKTLLVITVMNIFTYFVYSVCVTFLPTYLQQKDVFYLSSGLAGIYAGGVIVFAGLIGTIGSGYVADFVERFHAGSRVLTGGISLLLSAPLLAGALLTRNFLVFTVFFFLTGILLAAFNGPTTAALQDTVPSWLRSSALAFSLLIGHLFGDAVAPSFIGVLATQLDPTHGGHFRLALAGNDLTFAIVVTCVPAVALAGIVGIIGARWLQRDVVTAEHTEQEARVQHTVTV